MPGGIVLLKLCPNAAAQYIFYYVRILYYRKPLKAPHAVGKQKLENVPKPLLLVEPAVQVNEGVVFILSLVVFKVYARVHDIHKLPERAPEGAKISLPAILLHNEKLRHEIAESFRCSIR